MSSADSNTSKRPGTSFPGLSSDFSARIDTASCVLDLPENAFRDYGPRSRAGAAYCALVFAVTGTGILLAQSSYWLVWLFSQVLLAVGFLQWFVVLHEAGHYTLFQSKRANTITGHIRGFFAHIPFQSWRYIHSRHHRWTGWQDMDATTASLVPRPLSRLERGLLRFAWATHIPFVSVVYRVSNYWNIWRIKYYVSQSQQHRINYGCLQLAAAYGATIAVCGIGPIWSTVGLSLVLSFMVQDILLLSQHTHIPQHISEGEKVRPFLPSEQAVFTRSLRFPAWFSALILHFDAHELHHRYVHVPGYDLAKLPVLAENEVDWWTWLREAKKLSGDTLLFQNSDETGFEW